MRAVKVLVVSIAIIAGTLALAWTFLVPRVIDREVRTRLRDAGFAHAAFSVGDVALDRVELLDVTLAEGLHLGDIEVEAGPFALWRDTAADVVLRGPRIDARVPLGGAPQQRPLPFRKLVIEDGELTTQDQRIAVRGTIDLRGTVALEASAPALVVAGTTVTGIAATVRGPFGDLQVCATGAVAAIQLDACADLDGAARADVTWRATASAWSARGRGRIVRAGDALALEDATLDAAGNLAYGPLAIRGGRAHLEIAGDLGTRAFSARGTLVATDVTTPSIVLHHARLPIAITGKDRALRSEAPLVLEATSAEVLALDRAFRVEAPVVTAEGATELGGLALAAGERGAARLVARLHGIALDPLLRTASNGRMHGTGILDGEVGFTLDDGALALAGGSFAARAAGLLTAPALAPASTDGIHQRIAAALADFRYERLRIQLASGPDLALSLEGHGRRIPQALAIDVHVRGLFQEKP